MKFIRKKNLQETEELLYKPKLHWMFTVRHMVLSVPFFVLLLVLWAVLTQEEGLFEWPGDVQIGGYIITLTAYNAGLVIKYAFLALAVCVLLAVLWRVFQYICTEYGATNRRLIIKKGVFRVVITEISFDRIESLSCRRGIMGRIFNYGTIRVSGVGGTVPAFYMVRRPLALRLKIADIMDKNKTVTVVHGRLPKIESVLEGEPIQREEPVYRYGTFVRVLPEAPPAVSS
jgi:uncharacterized membrane protein YdbT with pleckstrin-like domain